MTVSVNYDKQIRIPPRGIKVFSVSIRADENVEVFVRFEGLNAVCYNCRGKDYLGNDFEKSVRMNKDAPRKFWCGADSAGNGYIVVYDERGNQLFKGEIDVVVSVESGEKFGDKAEWKKHEENNNGLPDGNNGETPEENNYYDSFDESNLQRLSWLNSTIGIDHSAPNPFLPVSCSDKTVKISGREITLNDLGFPLELTSYFNKSAKICGKPARILSGGMTLSVGNEKFKNLTQKTSVFDDEAIYSFANESENFVMNVNATVCCDGFIGYKVRLTGKNAVDVSDISLDLPIKRDSLKYFIGLGKEGGLFDGKIDWKWNENYDQDGFWAGDTNGGLKIRLKGENYTKPFVNIYYNHRKLRVPESWGNAGKGGIRFENNRFIAYSGRRRVEKGETLVFDFDLLFTPLKEIDIKKQFSMRFFHKMFGPETWLGQAKEGGANIINVHHGNDLNPFINYPFAKEVYLKNFASAAHDNGVKVKVYYTMRELTVNMPEFKAFRDFDYELISERNKNVEVLSWQKGAEKWINENVGNDVIPAWRQPLKGRKYKGFYDSAVITEGQSRLCNFYAEGLNYLIEKTDIDGIYIDDVAYDRATMKRVRKILDKKSGAYIDFHQWNHYADIAGKGNCANIYAELYPYVDKCWIGEGFDYDKPPEFWLTEISGIPFGVMSEMMDCGNKYRGLLFGMTNRLGWETNESDPLDVWRIFDEYNLGESELVGWWDDRNEIVLSNPAIRASEYRIDGKRYVAIANFSSAEQETEIYIEGFEKDEGGCCFYAPRIERFQSEQTIRGGVKFGGGKGLFLIARYNHK